MNARLIPIPYRYVPDGLQSVARARHKYPWMSQRGLAKLLCADNPYCDHPLAGMTFYSVYGRVRRHDAVLTAVGEHPHFQAGHTVEVMATGQRFSHSRGYPQGWGRSHPDEVGRILHVVEHTRHGVWVRESPVPWPPTCLRWVHC